MIKKNPVQPKQIPIANPPKEREIVLTVTEDGVMREIGGSGYGVFNHYVMDSVVKTIWVVGGQDPAVRQILERKAMGAAVAAMQGFKPQDEIEGMLASQATAMHFASMECFRRSIIPEQGAETASKLRRDGVNLSRGMADMLTALAKHRGQGQQTVVVKHVHVHAGGQAVVGAVSTGGALPTSAGMAPVLTHDDLAMGVDDTALAEVDHRGEEGA